MTHPASEDENDEDGIGNNLIVNDLDGNCTSTNPKQPTQVGSDSNNTIEFSDSHDNENKEGICTPATQTQKCRDNDNKHNSNESSSSSNSSGSGADNNYNADCSGASDDNQSSDDTSGNTKKHAMLIDSSSMIAQHHHHHHHKYKVAGTGNNKNSKYDDNSTTSASNSSNDGDDGRKMKPRTSNAHHASSGHKHRNNTEVVEHARQQLSKLNTTSTSTKSSTDREVSRIGGSPTNTLEANPSNKVSSTIDPQIDLSLVNNIPSSHLVLPLHATATAALLQWNQSNNTTPISATTKPIANMDPMNNEKTLPLLPLSTQQHSQSFQSADGGSPSQPTSLMTIESYIQLMEAVRPFFNVQGIVLPQGLISQNTGSENPISDQAHAESNMKKTKEDVADQNSNSNNPSSSEGFTSFFTTTDESGGDKRAKDNSNEMHHSASLDDGDDNSSMAVLARVKRKYNTGHKHLQQMKATTSSSDASSSSSNPQHRAGGDRNFSNSNANNNQNNHSNNENAKVVSRTITDMSSSNPSTTTSGSSGSGDNGMNTTSTGGSGSGSGTGSNNGSSGSGNDNDGKGSSEEQAKDDSNSGGDGMNGSDGSSNELNRHRGNNMIVGIQEESHAHAIEKHQQQMNYQTNLNEGRENIPYGIDITTREQKLLVKKRKRIVMRREYEAQQKQMSSSESSGDSTEQFFQPGRPLTLDQVLTFSKIPRIVVQGTPPLLVLHKNAACCRLTGIDSHSFVGKPISSVLSIPPFTIDDRDGNVLDDTSGEEVEHAFPISTILSVEDRIAASTESANRLTASLKNKKKTNWTIDRMIMTCGFGGNIQLAYLQTKLGYPVVGRDVTVQHHQPNIGLDQNMATDAKETIMMKESTASNEKKSDEDATSLTSNSDRKLSAVGHEQAGKILCRVSIAPIVSSKENVCSTTETTEPSKRPKHHHNHQNFHESEQRSMKVPVITHFVIQFEPYSDEPRIKGNGFSVESSSSSNFHESQQQPEIDSKTTVSQQIAGQNLSDNGKNGLTGSAIDNIEMQLGNNGQESTDVDGSLSVQSSDREPIVTIG